MVEMEGADSADAQMPTVTAADKFDENGNVKMDRLLDEDGNPIKNYPLPPDPRDRRNEFENTLMRAYMQRLAAERGEEGPPREYQSDFDRKFHELLDRNWDRYQRARTWAETSAPRALWAFDKTHDVMFWIGEKCSNALGLNQSRYQWVVDAAESQAYQEQLEREEEEEAMRELEEEENRVAAEEAAALEGGSGCETVETSKEAIGSEPSMSEGAVSDEQDDTKHQAAESAGTGVELQDPEHGSQVDNPVEIDTIQRGSAEQ